MNLSLKEKGLTDRENRLVIAKGKEEGWEDGVGGWSEQMQTTIHRMDRHQGPIVAQGTTFNILG